MRQPRVGNLNTLDNHIRGFVATHGIQRNGQARGQLPQSPTAEPDAMLRGGPGFGNHFTAIIMTARAANVVRQLGLATVRAFQMTNGLQGIMGTTHVATGLGGLFLRNSHFSYSQP